MATRGHPQLGHHYKKQAALARASQRCPETGLERGASLAGLRRGVDPIATRRGLVDLAHLKAQTPLPEAAKELCDVAADLKVDRQDIGLGACSTERETKLMSASGALSQYRIVHFATHGTPAGRRLPVGGRDRRP